MQSNDSTDRGGRNPGLENALRDLGFAVKSLQLYPANSPVVKDAVDRSFSSLCPAIAKSRISLEVFPSFLRIGEDEVGRNTAVIGQLASRLHRHGVARVDLDRKLDRSSMQRLAELIATDRKDLDELGGFDWVINREALRGVRLQLLELDRLFEAESEDPDDIWDALVRGYQEDKQLAEIDWETLAGNVDKLKEFVRWILDNVAKVGVMSGFSQVDVLRFVCKRIGSIATAISSEHVNFLVLAVRDLFDELDRDALLELLADPLHPNPDEAETAGQRAPKAEGTGDVEESEEDEALRDEAWEAIDITQLIAQNLDAAQVESLIFHALRTREKSSPRLYGLFARLMTGRADRDNVARQVHAALDQEFTRFGSGQSFLDNWPRLKDVLHGEVPERFVSASYESTLEHFALDDSYIDTFPVDRIRARLKELRPVYVLRRKTQVLLTVLESVTVDQHYAAVAHEIEEALPELLVHDDYMMAEQALQTFVTHRDGNSDLPADRRIVAEDLLDRFYNEKTLRLLIRDSLSKPDEEVEPLTRIFVLGGPVTLPVLLEALAEEETRHVRERLLKVLGAMGDQVVEAIGDHLNDQRWYFIRNLVNIIGQIGDPRLVENLEEPLKHGDARVRRETAQALMKIGGKTAGRLLLEALNDDDAEVRLLAIHGLGHTGPRAAAVRIRDFLQLPNWRGQNTPYVQAAAIAVGRLGDADSLPALRSLAKRPWLFPRRRLSVRVAAGWAVETLSGAETKLPPELRRVQAAPRISTSSRRARAKR